MKEFRLTIGDYVEAYNPSAKGDNNILYMQRAEPCIMFDPSVNKNGSWVTFSLCAKAYVRHTL